MLCPAWLHMAHADAGGSVDRCSVTAWRLRLSKVRPAAGAHHRFNRSRVGAASQGYETKASAEKGSESVKTSASAAKVVDLTEHEPAHKN